MIKSELIKEENYNYHCKVEVSATAREIAIELTTLLEAITEKEGNAFAISVALSAYQEYLEAKKNKESKEDA